MLVVSTVTTKSDIGHFVHSLIHHQLPSNNCLLVLPAKKLRLNLMLYQPFKGYTQKRWCDFLPGWSGAEGQHDWPGPPRGPSRRSRTGFKNRFSPHNNRSHTLYARRQMGQLVGGCIQGQSADAAAKSRGVERGEVTWLVVGGSPALGPSLRPCLLLQRS
jgi:hypothetical protein